MSGLVTLDKMNELMRVEFGAGSSVDDWKIALEEVKRIYDEKGICRVLVDVRKQEQLAGTMTLFEFGVNLPRSLKYAVLVELHIGEHRFIENVAVNRGINVKMFDTEENATDWLKQWSNKNK